MVALTMMLVTSLHGETIVDYTIAQTISLIPSWLRMDTVDSIRRFGEVMKSHPPVTASIFCGSAVYNELHLRPFWTQALQGATGTVREAAGMVRAISAASAGTLRARFKALLEQSSPSTKP